MPHFDSTSAQCLVLTYKEGLLSAIAHDLQLRVESFDMDVDPAALTVRARFDPASLRVVTAMHDGAPKPDALSQSDKHKIEENIADEVLHPRAHPEIIFQSTRVTLEGEGHRVEGALTLHGKRRVITFTTRLEGDQILAEVLVHQPDFDIKPYSAMLGTLKVKAGVTVRVAVPRASLTER